MSLPKNTLYSPAGNGSKDDASRVSVSSCQWSEEKSKRRLSAAVIKRYGSSDVRDQGPQMKCPSRSSRYQVRSVLRSRPKTITWGYQPGIPFRIEPGFTDEHGMYVNNMLNPLPARGPRELRHCNTRADSRMKRMMIVTLSPTLPS